MAVSLHIARVFNLRSEGAAWVPDLRMALSREHHHNYINSSIAKSFQKGVQFIVALGLVEWFTIEEVAIPCVLLGLPSNLYDDYLMQVWPLIQLFCFLFVKKSVTHHQGEY